jgi:hypothetical protein
MLSDRRGWLSHHIEGEQRQIAEGSILGALGNPFAWALSLPYLALFAVGNSYIPWAPTLVRGALGTSNTITAFIVAGIELLAVSVYPMAGRISHHSDERCGLAALGLALHLRRLHRAFPIFRTRCCASSHSRSFPSAVGCSSLLLVLALAVLERRPCRRGHRVDQFNRYQRRFLWTHPRRVFQAAHRQ